MAREQTQTKGYVTYPGVFFPLPQMDGVQYRDKSNKINPNTTFARFNESSGTYFTADPLIQNAIETHEQFKNGHIRRFETPEERREREKLAKIQQFIDDEKKKVETLGVACLPNELTPDTSVRQYASFINIETSEDGVKLSKEVILGKIYALFGLTFKFKKRGTE